MSFLKISIVSFLLFSNILVSQTTFKISGQITDSTGKGLDGVLLSLLKTNKSTIIKTAFTDEFGYFEFTDIKSDSFLISVINIGFLPYTSDPFFIKTVNNEFKFPTIKLKAIKDLQLSEVNIVSKIPFVERKIDRTIVNPVALISNAGSNALEVLAKSPGVMVTENGTIKLKGKSGVIILIDGKPTYLSGNDLESYLKSIPASEINQIELMTNPPAQYDAAGNSGVINIKTKKNKLKGINGSLSLNYAQGRYARSNDNFNLNFSNKKLSFYSNFSYGNNNSYHDLTIIRRYKNDDLTTKSIFTQNTYIQPSNVSYSSRLGMDYYLTNKSTIGITAKGLSNQSIVSHYNYAQNLNADNTLNSIVIADNDEKDQLKNGTLNLNFRHEFDSTGKLLTVDADYVVYQTKLNQTFKNNVSLPDNTNIYNDFQNGNLPANINIYAFKTDFTNPLKKGAKFEAGMKSSYTQTDNQAIYSITQNNITLDNNNLSNHFKYNEMINSAYLNFSKTVKRVSFQSGLRFESTTLNGNQLGNPIKPASSFDRNYNSLFPTIYISYQLDTSSNHTLNLSYGKRVSRPYYEDLNPFTRPLDKYTFYEGNPFLKPTFAHNASLAYSYKQLLTATFSYNNSNNQIQETIEINNGLYYSRPGNIGSSVLYNLSLEANIPISKWLTTNIYTEAVYSEYKSNLYTEILNSSGTYWYININNSLQLKKDWSVELSGEYLTNFIESQFSMGDFGHLTFGIQKKILKNMGSLKFSMKDILHSDKIRGRINNLHLTDANWFGPRDTQVASFTFTYRFGKTINSKPKYTGSGSEAEQNRLKN